MIAQQRPDWCVDAAGSGDEGAARIAADIPDLIILDVFLPDHDGFDLVQRFQSRWPTLPVILVSGRDHIAMRTRAQVSGARGFLSKTTAVDEFIARIDAVLSGGTAFEGQDASGDVPVLTPRQAEILHLLAQGHGNKEVRYRLGIAERTVRAHLTELFTLLGVHGRMPAVIRARELGLIE